MKLKLRPFERIIERLEGQPSIRASGIIEGDKLVLSFDDDVHLLREIEIGEDELGVYALLEEQLLEVGGGYFLRISAEYEEPFEGVEPEPGCQVCLFQPENQKPYRDAVIARRMDPSSVNLMVPHSSSVSVYFNSFGRFNGSGTIAFPMSDDWMNGPKKH